MYYLAAFFIPFVILVIICIGNRVYPFGDNCILHVDMYHQYCPFFTEFLNKLLQGEGLMYSWNLGLGSDFVSLYAYYLASPLNWLILLCPKAHVIEFMTILILVKIAFCGLNFFLFLKEHYGMLGKDKRLHRNTALPALVFSSAYALSGFVAAYSWDIMWLDCIALFPLIMIGLEKLVKENKVGLYYVSLALCIFANYYISIMICIFLVFYFVYLFFSKNEGKKHWRLPALGRFTVYSALAGGTSAILLLPEIAVLGASGSAEGSFPKQVEWYFSLLAELGRGATAASVYTGNDHWPNLYAGAFCLVLVWLYLLNRKISWKEKLPRFLMLGFFLVSFANNQLDFIWHGMHFPQSLPGRQSFLYIFMLLSMGFATVRKWKGTRLWHIVVATVAALGLLLASSIVGDPQVTEPYALCLAALFVAAYGIFMLLTKLIGSSNRRLLEELAMGIAVLELAVNMAVTGFGVTSRVSYTEKQKDYEALLALAEERENASGENAAFYRVEDTGRKTKNDDALYGYASATIFSSLMNLDVSHFFQSLYMEGGKNFYSYNGSTPLTSAMLSVKYMLSDSPMEENDFQTLVGQAGDNYLYENTYCLPLGYMVDESVIDLWQPSTQNRIETLNELADLLGAEDAMVSPVFCESKEEEGRTILTIPESGYYYAAYITCGADTLTVSRTDGWSQSYAKTSHRYLINLGDCESGEQVYISNSKGEKISFTLYQLNAEAVEQAYRTLSRQTMELEEITDTSVRVLIVVEEPGRLILSIPADYGWSLYVDGEKTEFTAWEYALLSVSLSEGTHEIYLRYTTPGLLPGMAVSAGCIGLFALLSLCRWEKKRRMSHE